MSTPTLTIVPTSKIAPSADNPRGEIDRTGEEFAGLCVSIKAVGLLQPILVAAANGNGKHTILDGHRRHAAALEEKLDEIPVLVLPDGISEKVARLTANIQREDFSPVAQARAIKDLQEDGLTQVQAADSLGKSERWVRERLRLVTLPEKAQEAFDVKAIPLEASVEIQRIAEKAPQAAEAIAVRALREQAGVKETGEGQEHVLNFADKRDLVTAIDEAIEHEEGDASAAGSLFEVSHTITLSDLKHAGIDEVYLPLLEDGYAKLEKLDRWKNVRWTPEVLDEARAFGCLLEIEAPNFHGHRVSNLYITDKAWLAEHAQGLLNAQLAEAKKRKKADAPKPAASKPEKGSDAEKREKEKRRREREAEAEKRAAIRDANLELGQRAQKALKAPKVTLDEAKLLALRAIGREASDFGARGLVYCYHDYQDTQEGARGSTKVTYAKGNAAGDDLVKAVLAAKSPEEAFGVALRALALARFADQDCVAPSSQHWFSPRHGAAADVDPLISDMAERREILPDAIRLGVETHRKLRSEEAELNVLAAVNKSRAKAGVSREGLLSLPLIDEQVIDAALDARRLKEHDNGDETTYTLSSIGKKRLEKLRAGEKERQAAK
jgi:ParB/RepB/Spo0J family partition protein